MASNILEHDGMMYVGEQPWHGLGTKLDKVATAAEAIAAAKLDWAVDLKPVYLEDKTPVTGYFSTVRADINYPLGVVRGKYRPLQNKDAFRFFDAVVGVKEAVYHTAGSLGNGRKVWILAKLPGYIKVKNDVTEKYLLLSNSHDATTSVSIMFSPVRVVCENTLNIALSGVESVMQARLKHTSTLLQRVEDVREQLGIVNYHFNVFEQLSQKMANVQLNQKQFRSYLEKIGLVSTVEADEKMKTKALNIMNEVTQLYEHGKGNDQKDIKGTVWTAFNAVAEYADYHKTVKVKGGKTAIEARANSLLFGTGRTLKQKAWDGAVALVK